MLHQRKMLVVEMDVRRAMILKMKMIGIAETDLVKERPRHQHVDAAIVRRLTDARQHVVGHHHRHVVLAELHRQHVVAHLERTLQTE